MPQRPKYSRPGYKACYTMVKGDAQKALKIARKVKSLMNVELKFVDIVTTPTVNTTATIHQASLLNQGDTGSTRDGSQVRVKSLLVNYSIVLHTSAVATNVRVIIVSDTQTNGALFAASDLLEDITANDAINSPYNLDNIYRFRILSDKRYALCDSGRKNIIVSKFIKLNTPMRFSDTGNGIADILSQSYAVLFISNEATNVPTVNLHTRMRYLDN